MPNEQKTTRKLKAILSADVKGYSFLMADDEAITIQTLTDYRKIMSACIEERGGRVVDAVGDNLLAEFGSAVDAVECAVEIQKKLDKENARFVDDRKLRFRIGVNIGDVVQDGDRIYGSGVNIAARIEGLAEPGGVCISRNAYGQIRDKLDLGYEYLGEHSVKNIKQPVKVYKVLMDPEDAGKLIGVKAKPKVKRWVLTLAAAVVVLLGIVTWQFYQTITTPEFEPASIENMAFPLPDKPSIAVLPFVNMSGDREQEYIGDGLSENIISSLSKISKMLVIARNSTFSYKAKSVKVQQVAEELGVRYVLEGSVQKSGDRLRITVQLIDALSGHHLWSEKYDRKMKDLFDLQDEITKKIVTELQVELTYGEMARVYAKDTVNMEAWSNLVKGIKHSWMMNKEDVFKGRKLIKRAIELDPGYVAAWAWLGSSHLLEARQVWCESPIDAVKRCYKATQKALELDENHPFSHANMAGIYIMQRKHEKAISEGKKAITLDPNYASGHWMFGIALHFAGHFDEAINIYKKAMRLNPSYPPMYLWHLAECYTDAGSNEEAISAFKQLDARCKQGQCPPWWGPVGLARAYVELDKDDEARVYMAKALKVNPKLSLEKVGKQPYKDPAHLKRYVEALRKAGLPKHSPSP